VISAASLVRSARHRAGLTQRELARRAKVPQPTIAAIERGRQDPRYKTLSRLIRACGYDIDFDSLHGEGVDRTLIAERLRLTPTERALQATQAARALRAFRAARRVS
jgi:transcriptional regulator with XRE-family HTH domain